MMIVALVLFLPASVFSRPVGSAYDGPADFTGMISDQFPGHGADGDPVGGERIDDEIREPYEPRVELSTGDLGFGDPLAPLDYESLDRLIDLIRNPLFGLVGVGSVPTLVSP